MQKSHRFKEKQNKITYVDLILPLAIPRPVSYTHLRAHET